MQRMMRVAGCALGCVGVLQASDVGAAGAADCIAAEGWDTRRGNVIGGPPYGSPPIRRYSGTCAVRTFGAGAVVSRSLLTPASPAPQDAVAFRFALLAEGTGGSTRVLEAVDAAGQVVFAASIVDGRLVLLDRAGAAVGSAALQSGTWNTVQLAWQAAAPGQLQYSTRYREIAGGAAAARHDSGSASVGAAADRVARVGVGQYSSDTLHAIHFDLFDAHGGPPQAEVVRHPRGDANGDTGISGPDLVLVQLEAATQAIAPGQPDCNEDGGVSGLDIVCVSRIASGIDALD